MWNPVQDIRDWNSDTQSPPFERKMFSNNTTASSNPQCCNCTLKWGNLFLPMRCIILRELLVFAVLQVTGSPISLSMASSMIREGQWEKIHYIGKFSHLCSDRAKRDKKKKKKINFLNSGTNSRKNVKCKNIFLLINITKTPGTSGMGGVRGVGRWFRKIMQQSRLWFEDESLFKCVRERQRQTDTQALKFILCLFKL